MKWRHQEEAKKTSKDEEARRQAAAAAAGGVKPLRHVTDDVRSHQQRDVIATSDSCVTSDDDSDDDITDDVTLTSRVIDSPHAERDVIRRTPPPIGNDVMSSIISPQIPRMHTTFRKPASIMSVADILDLRVTCAVDYNMTSPSSDVTKMVENGVKFSPLRLV